MTKQITNNNNQTFKKLLFEKLELEYCKAELDALRVENLEFGDWKLRSINNECFALSSVYLKSSRTCFSCAILLNNSKQARRYGNIFDVNNQHNSISKITFLNKINSQ
jgi:hypothetical protein